MSGFGAVLAQNKEETNKIKAYEKAPITTIKRNVIAGSLVAGGLVFTTVFAMQIISGIIALFATVLFGVGGFMGIRFLRQADPLIQQKTRNLIVKKMIEEARKNSVYQLKNQVLKNTERLKRGRSARDKIGGMISGLKSGINPENKGKSIYEKKVKMLEVVEEAYKQVKENLTKAAQANKQFEEKVSEYEDMEKYTQQFEQIIDALGDTGGMDIDEMMSLAAFEHIEGNFDNALTAIENKASDMKLDME